MVGATSPHGYRALVVEDEADLCQCVIGALAKEGFDCTGAANGSEALAHLSQHTYDVIVTDLAMPIVNGHSLAVDVLSKPIRPVVIVVTGVNEPRIAKDLIKRGVDEIIFKPVEFAVLSAKVLALVEKAAAKKRLASVDGDANLGLPADYAQRLDKITNLPPFSPAVFDIFRMAQSDQGNAEQLAANLARDASLALEVLRLANSVFYNPCGESITELRIAVARIGRRRICALALSRHLISTTQNRHTGLTNVQLAWRQSVGAGVAIEMLIDAGGYRCVCDELFLCALMHALGRLVQISAFPEVYAALIARCKQKHSSLSEEENGVFPHAHSEILARLLKQWGIAASVYEPLHNVERSYEQISKLSEPMRTQVELLKIASFIGRITAGDFESWDQLDFPPPDTLKRLGLRAESLEQVIDKTLTDTQGICSFGSESASEQQRQLPARPKPSNPKTIEYLVTSAVYFDWMPYLFPAMSISPNALQAVPESRKYPLVFNLIGASDREVLHHQAAALPVDVVIVSQQQSHLVTSGQSIVTLPCSFSALQEALSPAAASSNAVPLTLQPMSCAQAEFGSVETTIN